MKRFITRLAVCVAAAISVCLVVVTIVPHSASAIDFFGGVCQGAGANSAACSGSGKDTLSGTDGIIIRAAQLLSIIAGIAAVIVIMVAGIMFITAAGDSGKIETAKKTITYAVVGLIVIVLARTIIIFVVSNV